MPGEECCVLGTATSVVQRERPTLSDAKRAQLENARRSKTEKAIARRAAARDAEQTALAVEVEGFEITITARRKRDALGDDKAPSCGAKRLLVGSGGCVTVAS